MKPASTVVNVATRARIGGVGVRVIGHPSATPVVSGASQLPLPLNISCGPSSVSVVASSREPPAPLGRTYQVFRFRNLFLQRD